jgi:hypothetical protein
VTQQRRAHGTLTWVAQNSFIRTGIGSRLHASGGASCVSCSERRCVPQHAAVAAVASLLRLPVCRDAAAWLAGELHRAALHPGGGQAAAVRGQSVVEHNQSIYVLGS